MRRTTLTVVAITAATVVLASCSSSKPTAPAAPPASSPAATLPSAAPDASALTARITKAIPTAKLTKVYTADTDPNVKLGRPHQYVSKTFFEDSRASSNPKAVEQSADRTTIVYGGTVEVFANAEDAQAWTAAIDTVNKAIGGITTPDYMYRHGAVVVRVSHLLTADQADAYDKALA